MRCGDLLCPSATVCHQDQCVTPSQLRACDGQPDGCVEQGTGPRAVRQKLTALLPPSEVDAAEDAA